ncbi:3-oxoacyl-[acyl-carrier-protein] synthase III C-terminal domain-containing protein [Labilibaculum antarcticum]|uniref:3-oxoacyl-[acyl-carrier-protein] synthase III C-terminal domain-containing protein n=1 Tax=Labilibaculum antarcticum TaxID=1717717 RepID=UPI000BBA7E79
MINIEKYGNITTTSIPLCLRKLLKILKKGDHFILSTFGGNYTWRSIFLKGAYSK